MTMNILVLGAAGMLGSMVYSYLKADRGLKVIGTSKIRQKDLIYFDVYEGFGNFGIDLKDVDYVINCIGITKPYCHDENIIEVKNAIMVNSLFPYTLAELASNKGFKVIQIATDGVYSGAQGGYTEDSPHDPVDAYGKTKSLGEVSSGPFLNIRCSIIGPEIHSKVFLLEWFLKQPKNIAINGFFNHLWNGVTTLQFAELTREIILQGKFDTLISESHAHHFVPNDIVSKYKLLCLFNKIFDKEITVKEHKGGEKGIDRTLGSSYKTISYFYQNSTIENEIMKLKKFTDETGYYGQKR